MRVQLILLTRKYSRENISIFILSSENICAKNISIQTFHFHQDKQCSRERMPKISKSVFLLRFASVFFSDLNA